MTEEEAKTKWCPHARTAFLPVSDKPIMPPAFNRSFSTKNGLEIGGSSVCLGSQCMSWRWEYQRYNDEMEEYEEGKNGDVMHMRSVPAMNGYCGLAGKP